VGVQGFDNSSVEHLKTLEPSMKDSEPKGVQKLINRELEKLKGYREESMRARIKLEQADEADEDASYS
jgi:hypothetical protein